MSSAPSPTALHATTTWRASVPAVTVTPVGGGGRTSSSGVLAGATVVDADPSSPPRPNTSSDTATASSATTPVTVPIRTRRVECSAGGVVAVSSGTTGALPTVTVLPCSSSSTLAPTGRIATEAGDGGS